MPPKKQSGGVSSCASTVVIQKTLKVGISMATYEYICKSCSNVTQIERNMSDDEVLPLCCGELMTRVWQPAPIIFNGTGFYKTGG